MVPDNIHFGGGVSQTVLNPLVLAVVLLAGLVICFAPRNRAIAAFLGAALLIPIDQVLLIGPFHFPMLRLLALFGLIRILWARLSGKETIFSGGMNGIDRVLIGLALFTAVDGVLLWGEMGEVIYQLGNLYTAFGCYFLLRFLIRDEEDVKRTLRVFAWVAAVVAVLMTYEVITGRNLFYSALGGARAAMFATVMDRDGHSRATGPFGHPNLAGTFGGFLFPLFIGLWWKEKKERKYAVVGMAATILIPCLTSSSTALFGLIGGVFALCMWALRRQMRMIRWGIVLTLISLHLYMKSPVWHIISDVDLTGSSSSYHRYQLVNQCILHFWNWALVGTKSYGSWGWDMWDLSNQYVWTADTAGLIPFVLFLSLIVLGFKYVGRMRRFVETEGDRTQEFFVWAIGASLFSNVVSFFGIDYFDQTIVVWYALLAMITTITVAARNAEPAVEPARPDFGFTPALASGPQPAIPRKQEAGAKPEYRVAASRRYNYPGAHEVMHSRRPLPRQ
ncbi:MAG TPA: hypothetical protein VGP19_08875 [Candidatus Acidoferrales bacterium]|nr:hypothetical protein [Candidatus Acidoferrales bacterium]